MNIDGAAKIHEEMLIFFFVWIRGSFQRSKYIFPAFKAIKFLLSIGFFPSFGTSERSGADKNWS